MCLGVVVDIVVIVGGGGGTMEGLCGGHVGCR
jgi:hypothetical protein